MKKPRLARPLGLLTGALGAFALMSALLMACSRPEAATEAANATDPRWVSQTQPHAKVAVVFVHGLFGDTIGTWTHPKGITFFQHLKASKVGSQVDEFAFGFTSKMFGGGSLNIGEAANKLHEWLKNKDVLDYPQIVFVAHSMGGLVVLRHLISHPGLAQKVPLVYLYAVPQEGAQISAIADIVAKNPALTQMLPADRNGYLQQLSEDWARLAGRPPVKCAYETRPTYGVMIVKWSSATRFCDLPASAVDDADHITIVKPDRADHPAVVPLINAMNDYVIHPTPKRSDVDISFKPHATMKAFGPPLGLELTLDDPELSGPFAFASSPPNSTSNFHHHKLSLPPPGTKFGGYVNRLLFTAGRVTAGNAQALKTHVCLKMTKAALPPDGILRLNCQEADSCAPQDANGTLAPCGKVSGEAKGGWLNWLPSAMAQTEVREARGALEPAPGDWLIPRLDTLRQLRGTSGAVAFSEVLLVVDSLAGQEADEASYELKINGHRLWINGRPAWTHAQPLKGDAPLGIAFGLENLDSSGMYKGREQLDVTILLLRNKKTVLEDVVRLDFFALRDQDESLAVSSGGRKVRWSAKYFPAPINRYQILAYGGKEADTLLAKEKFDAAKVVSQGAEASPLVGVVRAPNKANPSWGIAVGESIPSGQVRFSFDAKTAMLLCERMQTAGATRQLKSKGFPAPSTFGVREIAKEIDDNTRKPVIECSKFSVR